MAFPTTFDPKWTGDYACQIPLATGEIKWYSRDFNAELTDALGNTRTITAVDVTSIADDRSQLTIDNIAVVDGRYVTCQISNGKEATSYRLWYEATMSDGTVRRPLPILVYCDVRPS